MYWTLIAQTTEDLFKLGVRNGTAYPILSISALIGTPIASALLSADHGRFLAVQIFTGGVEALETVCNVLARGSMYG